MKIKRSFSQYFTFVGYPFEKILNKIGINKNINQTKKIYQNQSIKNFKYIKVNSGVIETIKILKKNKIKLGLLLKN